MLQAELHTDRQAWPESMILFQLINLFKSIYFWEGQGEGRCLCFYADFNTCQEYSTARTTAYKHPSIPRHKDHLIIQEGK